MTGGRGSRLGRCLFTPDPTTPPDTYGRRYCRCGAPEGHPRHDLPATDPDQAAAEQRRLGERAG